MITSVLSSLLILFRPSLNTTKNNIIIAWNTLITFCYRYLFKLFNSFSWLTNWNPWLKTIKIWQYREIQKLIFVTCMTRTFKSNIGTLKMHAQQIKKYFFNWLLFTDWQVLLKAACRISMFSTEKSLKNKVCRIGRILILRTEVRSRPV